MNQIEKIKAILNELLSRQGGTSCLVPESMWCVSFNFTDSHSVISANWIEIMGNSLNISYNDDENPDTVIPQKVACFPQYIKFNMWESKTFAACELVEQFPTDKLPDLIDSIIRHYYGLDDNYNITYKLEDMNSGITAPQIDLDALSYVKPKPDEEILVKKETLEENDWQVGIEILNRLTASMERISTATQALGENTNQRNNKIQQETKDGKPDIEFAHSISNSCADDLDQYSTVIGIESLGSSKLVSIMLDAYLRAFSLVSDLSQREQIYQQLLKGVLLMETSIQKSFCSMKDFRKTISEVSPMTTKCNCSKQRALAALDMQFREWDTSLKLLNEFRNKCYRIEKIGKSQEPSSRINPALSSNFTLNSER